MSKTNYDVVTPIQSYNIHRTEYSIKYGSERDVESADIKTLVGTIITVEGISDEKFEKKEDSFSGFQYQYHILSHYKRLDNFTGSSSLSSGKNSSEEGDDFQQVQSEIDKQNFEDEEYKNSNIVKKSLLYKAYSNEKYEVGHRVFVSKRGSYLTIEGVPQGNPKAKFIDGKMYLDEECEIRLDLNKSEIDNDDNEVSPEPQKVTQDALRNIDTTESTTVKKTSRYNIHISEGCEDSFVKNTLEQAEQIADKKAEDPDVVIFEAYEYDELGKSVKGPILGKTFVRGKKYFDGSLIVAPETKKVNLPLFMLKDLEKMAKKFRQDYGKPLQVLSGFRTYEHQKRLRERYEDYLKNPDKYKNGSRPAPAARPGASKHNFAEAVDFKINILDSNKWKYNTSFTYKKYSEGDWPAAFRWLHKNAENYNFKWPQWARANTKSFEGWHFDYVGPKQKKGAS